jgi:hypothetical protein
MSDLPNYKEIFMEYAREPEQIDVGDGAALLDCVSSYIHRYVSASDPQVAILALWAVHTYEFSEIDCTPYLAITSAEKQSGKTRLLDVLKTLVKNPWSTADISAAVLFRTVDAKQPTLLMDESDATFNSDKERAEAIRGILNTGYQRGGVASRCVGKDFELKDFSTFCPKAIAGIGKLPGTVADRSIPIRLKRAPRGTVKKFRKRDVEPEAKALQANIARFADSIKDIVAVHRPPLPDELSDRQQDATECLVTIADLAGGNWPALARTSLIALCVEAQDNDDSIGHTLLSDIRQVFDSKVATDISSSELAKALAEIETSPWSEWSQGKPITPNKVAKLLKPYCIKPKNLRAYHGYTRKDFEESWGLYLRPQSDTSDTNLVTPCIAEAYSNSETDTLEEPVALPKSDKPNGIKRASVVSLPGPPEGTFDVFEGKNYTPDSEGPGCTCQQCGSHFGTIAGWRCHITGKRCIQVHGRLARKPFRYFMPKSEEGAP